MAALDDVVRVTHKGMVMNQRVLHPNKKNLAEPGVFRYSLPEK
jgi:hypothetical protein